VEEGRAERETGRRAIFGGACCYGDHPGLNAGRWGYPMMVCDTVIQNICTSCYIHLENQIQSSYTCTENLIILSFFSLCVFYSRIMELFRMFRIFLVVAEIR